MSAPPLTPATRSARRAHWLGATALVLVGCGADDWLLARFAPTPSDLPYPPPPQLDSPFPTLDQVHWAGAPAISLEGRCHPSVREVRLYRAGGARAALASTCAEDGRFAAAVELSAGPNALALSALADGGETRGISLTVQVEDDPFSQPHLRPVTAPLKVGFATFAVDTWGQLTLLSSPYSSNWGPLRAHYGPPSFLGELARLPQAGSSIQGRILLLDDRQRPVLVRGQQGTGGDHLAVATWGEAGWQVELSEQDPCLWYPCRLQAVWDGAGGLMLLVTHREHDTEHGLADAWRWRGGFTRLTSPNPEPAISVTQGALGYTSAQGPVVALRQASRIGVRAWRDGAWQALGSPLDAASTAASHLAVLQAPGGEPWLLADERTWAWDGDRWHLRAGPAAAEGRSEQLATAAGQVFLLRREATRPVLYRHDAERGEWSRLSSQPAAAADATQTTLHVSPEQQLYLGWIDQDGWRAQRWDGQRLTEFASATALRQGTVAERAAVETTADAVHLLAKQAGALTLDTWDGARWQQHPAALRVEPGYSDNNDQPVTALDEAERLYAVAGDGEVSAVWRWDDGSWTRLCALPLGWAAQDLMLRGGEIYLSATTWGSGETRLGVWQAQGDRMVQRGADLDEAYFLKFSRLSQDAAGHPVVAWIWQDFNLYVRRLIDDAWQEMPGDFGWLWQREPFVLRAADGTLYLLQTQGDSFAYQRAFYTWDEGQGRWIADAELPATWTDPPDVMHPYAHGEPSWALLVGDQPWVALKEVRDVSSDPEVALYRRDPEGWTRFPTALPSESFGGLHAFGADLLWSWYPQRSGPRYGGYRLQRIDLRE